VVPPSKKHKFWIIFSLAFAGEMIFTLPYHVIRYFRPTFLLVFEVTNTQIGDAFALYGITAALSYFPSGIVADRLSARKLMATSLFISSLGGLYFMTIPDQTGLTVLYGIWGISTILLFWSAMLSVTRDWGGKNSQGLAFGLLDGGRGLLGAGAASIAVLILSSFLPDNQEFVTQGHRTSALQKIIFYYTVLTFLAGLVVWFIIPEMKNRKKNFHALKGIKKVMTNKLVWLQSIVVICAYCGYRGLDYYALYGVEIWDMSEIASARLMSFSTYLRPVGAVLAGVLADRFTTKRMVSISFFLLLLTYLVFLFIKPTMSLYYFFMLNIALSFLAIYALRGIYFAFFEESKIPAEFTGTAAGLISVVGYSPDIFFGSVFGRILDSSPGAKGFQSFFFILAAITLIGILSVSILGAINRQNNNSFIKSKQRYK